MAVSSKAPALHHLGATVRRNALRSPDKVAYVCGDARLTWADVDAATDALAHGLAAEGVGKGHHVAVLGTNSWQFMVVELALFKLGATVVLINVALYGELLANQLDHADVTTVVASADMRPVVDDVRERVEADTFLFWGGAGGGSGGARTPDGSGGADVDALIATHRGSGPFELADVDRDDRALLVFSSGTTGVPKGAVNTYYGFLAKLVSMSFAEEFKEWEIGLSVTPLCMGGTQIMGVLDFALLGMTCVIAETFEPGEVLRLIEAERASVAFMVPTMINAIVRHPDAATRDLSSFTRVVSAGAPLPLEVYRMVRELGISVYEVCGTSETGGGLMIAGADKEARPRSVGRPMMGFEVRVVDDDDRDVATGQVGELIIRGDSVAAGYYHQPEIEAETYRNGWFHTGDLATKDEEGFYYLVDRKKDMIISGGQNVYPAEIEDVLYELSAVAEAAVVGLPHEHWGEAVTAFVVPAEGAALAEADIVAACRARLAGYQVPKAVVVVDELPKTVFGKLSKKDLRRDHADRFANSPAGSG